MFYSNLSKTIALCLGVFVTSFLFGYLVLAWVEPTQAPPGCTPGTPGCDVPLNTGPTGQSKKGGLILNTGGAATGLIVVGEKTNPVAGACPVGYDWYDYNNNGVKDSGECQRTLFYGKSTGNVGIGTTGPGYKLDVQGGDIYSSGYVRGGTGLCIGADCKTSWPAGGGGTVTNIATSSPLTGGPITTTGTIGITQASSTTNGYLSSTDWNTFNNKLSTASDYGRSGVSTTLYEGTTALSSKYLGISAQAADSAKLNGQSASYYLDTSATAQTKSGSLTVNGNLNVGGTITGSPPARYSFASWDAKNDCASFTLASGYSYALVAIREDATTDWATFNFYASTDCSGSEIAFASYKTDYYDYKPGLVGMSVIPTTAGSVKIFNRGVYGAFNDVSDNMIVLFYW